MRQQWCPGRFSSPPQKWPGNEASVLCTCISMKSAKVQTLGTKLLLCVHEAFAKAHALKKMIVLLHVG